MSRPEFHLQRSLRRSLAASTAEGVTAEVFGACVGGAVLTGWALHLGCSARAVGVLGALPFLAQLCQVPGSWLTARAGPRRAALAAVALSRQAFLPLALLPALPLSPEGRRALLVACAAAHHGLGILCNNAWTAWMGELVPARLRGRYFGRRTAICTAASAASGLAAGALLDRCRRAEQAELVLAALAALACAVGASSALLMARQQGGRARGDGPPWTPGALLRPLRDPAARPLLGYLVAWSGAVGLSAPFFTLYLVGDLRLGFGVAALQTSSYAAARVLTAAAWGRAVDRLGSRAVLSGCTVGLVLSPLAWIAARPGALAPLALDAALGGVLLAGHAIASFALPLEVAPARERPAYHAAFSAAGGVAFALTSAAGGALAAALPAHVHAAGRALSPLQLVFVGSFALRAVAAAAGVLLLDAPPLAPWAASAVRGPALALASLRGTRGPEKREAASRRPHQLGRWARDSAVVRPSGLATVGGVDRSSPIDLGVQRELAPRVEYQAGTSRRVALDDLR